MQPDVQALALTKAIRKSEGADYKNTTGDAGTSSGAYQFQPDTWKGYAKEVLGDENAPLTEENQNAVAYTKIKGWKDSGMGPAEIAAKWNHGSEKGWENLVGDRQINGQTVHYDTPGYVKKTIANFHQIYPQETQKYNPQSQENKSLTFADIPKSGTETNQDKGFLGDLATGDFKGAGMNALKGGEGLLNKIASPFVGLAAAPVQAIAKGLGQPDPYAQGIGTDISGTQGTGVKVSNLDVGSKTKDLLKAGAITGAVAASPEVPGLISKVFGKTLAPEVATQVMSKTGIPLKVFNTLSNTEKLNALGETLKGAQAGDAINIAKEMEKLKPGVGMLTKFMKSGVSLAGKLALAKVFGDTVGGLIHGATSK